MHEMTHITKGPNEVPAYMAQIQFLNARLQQYINGGTPVPPELQAAIESLAPVGMIAYQANGTPSSFTARNAEDMQNALSRLPVYNPTMRSRIIPGSSRVNVTRFFISGGGQ